MTIQTFRGRRVIVDDNLPVRAGATDGQVYTSFLFSPDAFGRGTAALDGEALQGFSRVARTRQERGSLTRLLDSRFADLKLASIVAGRLSCLTRRWMNKLITAIVEDDTSAVKKLLQADAGLATRLIQRSKLYDSGIFHWIYAGDTALHLAAAGYRVEIVRLLLAAGADPNAASNHRRSSPLHYAADGFITGPAWDAKQQVETIRCLLQNGADIHAQDMNGATPLHRAVRTRCAAAVRFLLGAGSDPTSKNKPGSTPFHLAVQNTGRGGSGAPAAINAQREIIKAFVSFGLSPDLQNSRGKSVADSVQSAWIREVLV